MCNIGKKLEIKTIKFNVYNIDRYQDFYDEYNNIDNNESYLHTCKVFICLIIFYYVLYKILKYIELM